LEKKVISCAEYGFGGAFLMYQEGINGICKPLRAGNDVKGNYPIGLSDAQIPSALMEDLPRAKKTRIVLFTDCFEEQKILIKEAALRELFPDLIEQLKEEMAELNKKKQEKIFAAQIPPAEFDGCQKQSQTENCPGQMINSRRLKSE